MIHKVEITNDAVVYQQTVEQLQKAGWTVAMVQYLDNQWIITCVAEEGSLKQ